MRPISTGGNDFARRTNDPAPMPNNDLSPAAPLAIRVLPRLAILAVAALAFSACVYRVNIQQGNFLEGRTVDQLQVGMTRAQVRYLLGTPMVPEAFDKDRWDYLYYFKRGRLHTAEQRHLIVYFKEDKVDKFDRQNVPERAPSAAPQDQAPIAKFPKI